VGTMENVYVNVTSSGLRIIVNDIENVYVNVTSGLRISGNDGKCLR
jgi:hypothetical protein